MMATAMAMPTVTAAMEMDAAVRVTVDRWHTVRCRQCGL